MTASAQPTRLGQRLDRVHRVGALLLGLGLWVFAILGLVRRLSFFSTQGQPVLGLSSNGVLSLLSLLVGAVLLAAAARGGRTASTVTTVIGGLFLLSGLAHLAILNTEANLLAFELPNVLFSLIAGMLLLFLGLYGRLSGGLPADNPYAQARHPVDDEPDAGGETAHQQAEQQRAQDDEMIAAEIAVAEGHATAEQARRVQDDAQRRVDTARREAWDRYEHPENYPRTHSDGADGGVAGPAGGRG